MRPGRYVGMARILRDYGPHATTGFALAANRHPDGIGLIDERGSLTWQEIQERADALAVGLAGLSDEKPTAVAILCRNHRGFVDAFLAASRLGRPGLLLNTGFSGPQLADVLEREGATLIVYDEEFAGLVAEARERIPGLTEVLSWVDDESATREQPTAEQLIDAHRGERPPQHAPGQGRAPDVGHHRHARRARTAAAAAPRSWPRCWSGSRGTAARRSSSRRRPSTPGASGSWSSRRRWPTRSCCAASSTRRPRSPSPTSTGATGIAVVPVMLERIMELPAEELDRYTLDALRFVSASGSRMRGEAVIGFMDRFGDKVYNSYNATEAGQISVASPADLRHAPDTAGRPVAGTSVRLVDDDGNDVPVGEVGRILLRGASEFDGYTTGDTKASLDGWMVSGDVGRMDADGRLYVVGRDDDMIVSGGENVYPVEVERAIGELPDVREVVVIGVDDEKFGQRLAAYVVPAEPDALDADDVRAHVKSQLAGYKVPRDVVFLDELPRNASGKVVVRDLPGAA